MLLTWLIFACGEVETAKTHRSLTQSEVLTKTVRTRDDWSIPKTGMVPHMYQDDERLVEAERLFQADQGMAAAKILLEIIQEDPKFIAAHSLLSAVLIQLGDVTQATTAAEKVVELAPSAWSHCNLGTVYILSESFDLAKVQFETALRLNPKYFLALRNLGSIAYQEKEYASAERYFRQFIRIEPEDTYAYVAYGQVLAEQGKLEAAKEVYLYRLQELEYDAEAHRNTPSGVTLDLPLALAEVYRRQGYIEESLRWFMQTIEWSWIFKGHWASETSYADQAYKRLVEVLMSLPNTQRRLHVEQVQMWFEDKKGMIPVMSQENEQKQFERWIQVVDVGP